MFGLHHLDTASPVNGIENPSLLYSAEEELLTSALLTPDPDPKFDISGAKSDDAPFGDFNTLGIYQHYNDSGPSSVQFGEVLESSEHGGSHLSIKDDSSGTTSGLNGGHGRTNGVRFSPSPLFNNTTSISLDQDGVDNNMFGHISPEEDHVSPPSQSHLKYTPITPAKTAIQHDHIQLQP